MPYKRYDIEDIREGLGALIYGKSKRAASELCGVPPNTLVRHFKHITGGKRPNVKRPLNKSEREAALEKLPTFEPKQMGQGKRIFLPHEELMIVEMLEASAQAAFPYNADALEATAQNLGQAAYGKSFTLGKAGKWRQGFERRHKERIEKVKSSSICQRRAAAATEKVRDEVFKHFNEFLDRLVQQGDLTDEQRKNLGNHLANADEVGGDERGKRKKVYQSRNAARWRTTTRDGDHNPFHVTLMLVTMATGIVLPGLSLIHSSPGSKAELPRMLEKLYDNIPMEWHVRRTKSGSMTRELFQDWAVGCVHAVVVTLLHAINSHATWHYLKRWNCFVVSSVLFNVVFSLLHFAINLRSSLPSPCTKMVSAKNTITRSYCCWTDTHRVGATRVSKPSLMLAYFPISLGLTQALGISQTTVESTQHTRPSMVSKFKLGGEHIPSNLMTGRLSIGVAPKQYCRLVFIAFLFVCVYFMLCTLSRTECMFGVQVNIKLASDLASWKAKCKVL